MIDMCNNREISYIFHFDDINNKNKIILRPCSITRKRIRRLLDVNRVGDFENIVPRPRDNTITVAPSEQKNKISIKLCIQLIVMQLQY